ncbi:hypothetical protein UPYG_G00288100 [Umbra pygmaea]|uniref:Epidermal growth factor receptor substrate 15 n=1 Tax=Umbra pygmaea TaxID=75934 RepID=A0ABD0W4C0_UMBPY
MMRLVLDCLRAPRQRARSERDQEFVEQDESVVQKTGEIRGLQDAVQQEGIELQEQRTDRQELEETLEKLKQHKTELEERLKLTRLECVKESQQILSLQAEEMAREMKVEEYEWELARARRKLKQLKMEVIRAQAKVEVAGERIIPLEESISQSYEEILQEENMLSILRGEQTGDATLPDHQQVEPNDTSPSSLRAEDGTVDIPDVPARSWGRSQSLPVYAEILANLSCAARANKGLADTQEEEETATPSSPKINKGEEEENLKVEAQFSTSSIAVEDLDFYHPDPFIHCESEHYLFKEDDLFAKTDKSDDDPFKGTDPFGTDVLFPEGNEKPYHSNGSFPDTPVHLEPGSNDETDNSLSCADNKASTGTQCFESEFPDEDESSDIEISYSREDLDTVPTDSVHLSFVEPKTFIMTERLGFKPIYTAQTCSLDTELEDEIRPSVASKREPFSQASRANTWAAGPNFSTESDPNGYEFDINAVSPPSDIEEIDITLGSISVDFEGMPPGYDSVESSKAVDIQACDSEPATTDGCDLPEASPPVPTRPVRPPRRLKGEAPTNLVEEPYTEKVEHCNPGSSNRSADSELDSAIGMEPLTSSAELNSKFSFGNNSFELNYEPSIQITYNYGFKLSPEHHSEDILDPFGADLSDEESDNQASLDPYEFEPTTQPENQDTFNPCEFTPTYQLEIQDKFDPYELNSTSQTESQYKFDPYEFGHTSQAENQENFDPYGFKLASFEDNQAIAELQSGDDTKIEDNNNTTMRDPFSFDFSTEASMDPYSSEPSNTAMMDLLGLEFSEANNVAESDCNNPNMTDLSGTVQTIAIGSNLLDLDSVFGSVNTEISAQLDPCVYRPGSPAGPDNFAFRERDTSHSESGDPVPDWMTVKSTSKESSSPVNTRTHSLDK